MSRRRVVVTGVGMLSPVGNTTVASWQALLAGQSGVGLIQHFDTAPFSTRFAGLVKDFNVNDYLSRKEVNRMDLFVQYGVVAGIQALKDANVIVDDQNTHRMGVAIGSGIGGLGLIEANCALLAKSGPRKISPFFVPATIINMISGHLSLLYGLRGPNISISTACATGVHNIGNAARLIAYGDADVMVAGGAEKASTPLGIGGFGAARALSTRNDMPQSASRPWDSGRDGFVLGDGAGAVVLEEYQQAKARHAKIYAEVVGFGMSSDAHHVTAPPVTGSGATWAMSNALRDARLDASQIGYINAHGTSTVAGDIAEVCAIKTVFGDSAKRLPISSTKSMTGHLLGAAGAVETIFTALALRDQSVPPTINLEQPDPQCDLDFVPHHARSVTMQYALCNAFGFGGTNASIILRKI